MTPTTMRACVITQPGGPEVLQIAERPVPSLQTGEVLLRVEAAGVNGADLLQRRGKYPVPAGISAEILGLEAAGEIVAVASDVASWKVGDRVAALLAGGGYAEYVAVPAGQCLPWPELPHGPATAEEAAALPETCCTVWSNVFEIGRLQPGETLLVHGGASGIGTTAIQLAVALGSKVLCTVGSDSKMLACKNLGAMAVFNYKTDDFTSCVNEVTGGQGVNVILDIVGGSYLQKNLECLTHQGRLVTIATRGGAKGELDIGLMMRKQASVTGSLLRPRSVAEKSRLVAAVLQRVWPLVKRGAMKPVMDNVFPLAEAGEAHRRLESGEHAGKVVLKIFN
ncbi:MAG: NAD(P)H-quinone oxidoreductase [Gemmatales bacterium]